MSYEWFHIDDFFIAKKVSSETNVMDLDDVADGMMPAVES